MNQSSQWQRLEIESSGTKSWDKNFLSIDIILGILVKVVNAFLQDFGKVDLGFKFGGIKEQLGQKPKPWI